MCIRDSTWIGDGKDGTVGGKSTLYDGLTGEPFHNPVVVGQTYMLCLLYTSPAGSGRHPE